MPGKLLQTTLLLMLAALLIALTTGCPAKEQPTPTPQPAPQGENGDPTPEPAPTPAPEPIPEPAPVSEMVTGPLGQVVVAFFTAIGEAEFDVAKTHCTETCWEENFAGIEEMYAMLSEEERAGMVGDLTLRDEQYEQLASATSDITGDTAILTIEIEGEEPTIFGFVMEGGNWLIDSMQ